MRSAKSIAKKRNGTIRTQATELEKEREVAGRGEDRFDAGEVILEIALIICSLTLLTKKKGFWLCGSALGVVGMVVTVSGFFLH
jgi:Domain of unknown function (DUF4337)